MTDHVLTEKVARAIYNWRRERMLKGAEAKVGNLTRITHTPAFWNQLPPATQAQDLDETRRLIALHFEEGMAESDLIAACVGAAIE